MGGISGLISLLCMVAVSSLSIGDAAPSLEGAQWLKGKEPVFNNQVTIVEFWRPSCGNCKAQIPHLTSLQRKYGDRLSVVAVSKESVETLEEFIKSNGDQMDFTIGKVTKELGDTYMNGVTGVPYAFLINKDGLIVWKGHPSEIDDILTRTIEGNVNVEELKNITRLEASLEEALNTNDPDTIEPINRELLAADPTNEKGLDIGIRLAKYKSEPEMIKEMFDKIRMKGLSDYKANSFAKMLIIESDFQYRYPEAALKFSLFALQQDPANDGYMDTYARVLYCLGDIENAIVWEKMALAQDPNETSYQLTMNYYLAINKIREKDDYNLVKGLKEQKTVK